MKTGFVIFVIFLAIPSHACALNSCPACGGMNVPLPLSTNENCGNPEYRVNCNNGTLEFTSAAGFNYKILSINHRARTLIISPPNIIAKTCQSADLNLGGLILDENLPFNISSHNTVMLFNCSELLLLSPLNCSASSPCRQLEDNFGEGSGCRNTLCCSFLKDSSFTSHRVRVRDGGCTAYTSVVDFKPGDSADKWNYGIELQWLPPN